MATNRSDPKFVLEYSETVERNVLRDYVVSTIWLVREKEYETMVFAAKDGKVTNWTDRLCKRTDDLWEAVQNHRLAIEQFSPK